MNKKRSALFALMLAGLPLVVSADQASDLSVRVDSLIKTVQEMQSSVDLLSRRIKTLEDKRKEPASNPISVPKALVVTGQSLDAFSASRASQFAAARSAFGGWDMAWSFDKCPSDAQIDFLRWDSCIDDDYADPNAIFRYNYANSGVLYINRKDRTVDNLKTGNLITRDPRFNRDRGLTVELTTQLFSQSDPNAFSIDYLDEGGNFEWGVHLSPTAIKLGSVGQNDPGVSAPASLSGGMNKIRIVQWTPRVVEGRFVYDVTVYLNDNPTPVLSGYAVRKTADPLVRFAFPRLLIGDNSNAPNLNAAFLLKDVKYAIGIHLPGTPLPSQGTALIAPELPHTESGAEVWNEFPLTQNVYAGSLPYLGTLAGASNWRNNADGSLLYDAWANKIPNPGRIQLYNIYTGGYPTFNRQAYAMEIQFKVGPKHEKNGFGLYYIDTIGSSVLSIDPDGFQIGQGGTNHGYKKVTANFLDDQYHTVRIVRGDDQLQYVYLDNNPVPVVSDYRIGVDQADFNVTNERGTFLAHSSLSIGDNALPDAAGNGQISIKKLRWIELPLAPKSVIARVPAPTLFDRVAAFFQSFFH